MGGHVFNGEKQGDERNLFGNLHRLFLGDLIMGAS